MRLTLGMGVGHYQFMQAQWGRGSIEPAGDPLEWEFRARFRGVGQVIMVDNAQWETDDLPGLHLCSIHIQILDPMETLVN